jgi:C1A family cysteine protease
MQRTAAVDLWTRFAEFGTRFDRQYPTVDEFKHRFEVFRANHALIQGHNEDPRFNATTLSLNRFSDMTQDEFRGAFMRPFDATAVGGRFGCEEFAASGANTPSAVDWRDHGAVTSVKDQGQCGSCWSFSAAGAVEGLAAVQNIPLVSLSEQQLVDCASGFAYGSHGCNGGSMDGAFKYVMETGLCTEAEYPYVSGVSKEGGACDSGRCEAVVVTSGCADVRSADQVALKEAVAKQPVSVAIDAESTVFQFYSSGVIESDACGTTLNHGVLAVGYGTEAGKDYWLIKNSWSADWGDEGYVKIGRSDSSKDNGVCGVAMQASFPLA